MLAVGDYITARQFAVPERFTHVGDDGVARQGVVVSEDFNEDPSAIVEHALAELESDLPKAHGMSVECDEGIEPVRISVSFPEDPHIMLTYLIETSEGRLRPVLSKNGPKPF